MKTIIAALLTVASLSSATSLTARPVAAVEVPTAVAAQAKNTVYGNFGSATSNCVVTGDFVDVDITLKSVRGTVSAIGGTVSSDASHIKAFTHLSNPSRYTVRDSVQLSLVGVAPGTYTATVFGTGTTNQGVFAFTTSCDFTVQ